MVKIDMDEMAYRLQHTFVPITTYITASEWLKLENYSRILVIKKIIPNASKSEVGKLALRYLLSTLRKELKNEAKHFQPTL